MEPETTSPWMTDDEAAAYMRISKGALRQHRHTGTGPTFYKAGRAVLYIKADLDAWVLATKRTMTQR